MGEGVGVSSHWFFEIRPAHGNGQRGPVYPARRLMQHSIFVSWRTHGCKRARYCQGAYPYTGERLGFSTKVFSWKSPPAKKQLPPTWRTRGLYSVWPLITGLSGMKSSAGFGENSIQYSPVGHGGTQAITPRQGAVPNVTGAVPNVTSKYISANIFYHLQLQWFPVVDLLLVQSVYHYCGNTPKPN